MSAANINKAFKHNIDLMSLKMLVTKRNFALLTLEFAEYKMAAC